MINFIKRLFKHKPTPKPKEEKLYKVEATPERIALKEKIDRTMSCKLCGKRSGFFKITLRKLGKNEYICNECLVNECGVD